MILGISGKIGSGKDTVSDIIKELTPDLNWEEKKFADALKDIVCRLIGCTREQLEDRDFKEKPLGEEWWVYDLGNGDIRSRWSFDDPKDNEMAEKRYLRKTTPRLMLQLLGTEGVRNVISPNAWVNATMAGYQPVMGIPTRPDKYYPNWLISDMRFPNELKAVVDKGGITLRIERPMERDENDPRHSHPSETALDDASFHYILYNDGDLNDLRKKVEDFLRYTQII